MDAPAQRASGGTLLIVDDMPANPDVVTNPLGQQGHRAVGAPPGDEGTERAEDVPPDLIEPDVQMRHRDEPPLVRVAAGPIGTSGLTLPALQ